MAYNDLTELTTVVRQIRTQFDLRLIDAKVLKEAYLRYNPNVEIDSFVEMAIRIFPRLNCGLSSAYVQNFLGEGEIVSGYYICERHTFLMMSRKDEDVLVDITSDQYGGPSIYVGPVIKPWLLPQESRRSLGVTNNIKKLVELRNLIAFLKEVPDSIYFALHPGEFFVPDNAINKMREELEHELGHYVMSYRKGVFNLNVPPEKHLCANLKSAHLDPRKLHILRNFERRSASAGVTFVAYHKPLTLIPPKESKLYEFYCKNGLSCG